MPHIDSCISLCGDGPFISGDSELAGAKVARKFALVYHENGRFQDEMELPEKSLEARQKKQESEDVGILYGMFDLTENYGNIGRTQEAIELYKKVLEAKQRIYGSETG